MPHPERHYVRWEPGEVDLACMLVRIDGLDAAAWKLGRTKGSVGEAVREATRGARPRRVTATKRKTWTRAEIGRLYDMLIEGMTDSEIAAAWPPHSKRQITGKVTRMVCQGRWLSPRRHAALLRVRPYRPKPWLRKHDGPPLGGGGPKA